VNIAIASDHAGFAYKALISVSARLRELGHELSDFGTDSETPVDYPGYVRKAAQAVARGDCERGIVLGGSGNGEAIVANKVAGIRCALCWNEESARLARAHNDANVMALGQRLVKESAIMRLVEIFLTTPFEGGRHEDRVRAIEPGGTSV
jgi:ribose 5-phosphate isomerase B